MKDKCDADLSSLKVNAATSPEVVFHRSDQSFSEVIVINKYSILFLALGIWLDLVAGTFFLVLLGILLDHMTGKSSVRYFSVKLSILIFAAIAIFLLYGGYVDPPRETRYGKALTTVVNRELASHGLAHTVYEIPHIAYGCRKFWSGVLVNKCVSLSAGLNSVESKNSLGLAVQVTTKPCSFVRAQETALWSALECDQLETGRRHISMYVDVGNRININF